MVTKPKVFSLAYLGKSRGRKVRSDLKTMGSIGSGLLSEIKTIARSSGEKRRSACSFAQFSNLFILVVLFFGNALIRIKNVSVFQNRLPNRLVKFLPVVLIGGGLP